MRKASAQVILFGLLLLAGCAADAAASHSDDNDKNTGVYTGLTGGGVSR